MIPLLTNHANSIVNLSKDGTSNILRNVKDGIKNLDAINKQQLDVVVAATTDTLSNIGVGGIGVFKQKVGVIHELKNINSASNKVTVVNDAANDEIDIDIVEGNIVHDNLSGTGTNTHGQIDTHLASVANPHSVTKSQVSLGNVLNVAQIENGLGTPKIISDIIASQPAAGNAGVVFISTDEKSIYRDTGSVWEEIARDPGSIAQGDLGFTFTEGSMPFADATGNLIENTEITWDNANNVLKVAPSSNAITTTCFEVGIMSGSDTTKGIRIRGKIGDPEIVLTYIRFNGATLSLSGSKILSGANDFSASAITLNKDGTTFNFGFWTPNSSSWGTDAIRVISIAGGNTTAPTDSPADVVQMWANDWDGADTMALFIRTEEDTVHVFGSKVGFGTITPATALDIDSNSNSQCLRLRGVDAANEIVDMYVGSNGSFIIDLTNGNDTAQFLDIKTEDNDFGIVIRQSDGVSINEFANLYITDAADPYLSVNITSAVNTDALVVTKANYVGIGMLPTDKCQIGDGTNYANFAPDGELTFTGTARVMKNVDIEPIFATRPISNPPAEGKEDNFLTHDFDSSTDESVFFHFELPHDYADAGIIHIHFDFFVDTAPASAAGVVWGVEYKKQSVGDNFSFSSGTTTGYTTTAVTTGTPANDKKIHQSAEINLTTSGFVPGDYILLRLFRDANGTGGTDDFADDARVVDYHIEYLSDRWGETT